MALTNLGLGNPMACQDYCREHEGQLHPLLNPQETPCGGISLYHPDWMHTKSLGTDAYLLGSCLAYMAQKILPASAEQNVAIMWDDIREYQSTHKAECRMSRLTWTMVKNDPFPKLSAKAMEIRWLIAPVAEVLKPWRGNTIVAWLYDLLQLSKGMDDLVFGNKTFRLTAEEARALGAATFAYNAIILGGNPSQSLLGISTSQASHFVILQSRTIICCTLVCMPATQASIQDWAFATKEKTSCPW